jgi:tRNA(Ile)-lysidine synthase
MRNHALVHRVLENLKNWDIRESDCLCIALSGGADSVALLHLLKECQPLLCYQLRAFHVHHGAADSPKQAEFRFEAQNFCKDLSAQLEVPFLTNHEWDEALRHSEDDLRQWRWTWLRQWAQHVQKDFGRRVRLALAHHQDDLLETRLIHLIRGAGEQGLGSLKAFDAEKIRPLFNFTKQEVLQFLIEQNLKWIEDPSNLQPVALRNFIRNEWLLSLESARPGSSLSLARSLEILVEQLSDTSSQLPFDSLFVDRDLSRVALLQLSRNEQKRVVAIFFSRLNLRHYGHSHVEEFLKRLDTPRKELTFEMLAVTWIVSPEWIRASRV